MRKTATVAAVLAMAIVVFVPGCREDFETPGGESIAYTGTFLDVQYDRLPGIVYTAQLVGGIATFDVTFSTQDPDPEDDEPATDIIVKGYTIDYFSDDPLAPFLPSLNVDHTIIVRANEIESWTGLAYATAAQGQAYTTTADTLYTAQMTFYCENEFGYEFEVVEDSSFVMTPASGSP